MNQMGVVRNYQVEVRSIHLVAMDGIIGSGKKAFAEDVRLADALMLRATVGSDVRLELVAALRARIKAGTYRVAAADLAERLMRSMR